MLQSSRVTHLEARSDEKPLTHDDNLEAALDELAAQRRALADVQSSYAVILQSRFHALRMLWLSLKAVLGLNSQHDEFAAWSPGAAPVFSAALRTKPERAQPARPRQLCEADELAFIERWNERWAHAKQRGVPDVCVVIPVYNHAEATVRCLDSIAQAGPDRLLTQFVLVDDGSTDRTPEILARLENIDYVRGSNGGFIEACNRGAKLATADLICFLNNDTAVKSGWLASLVSTARSAADVGAVGAKLVYPDGRLQEAGGIIWRDATGNNYGRGEEPSDSRFNYRRDVDYCSGAALLVRTDLFARLGGFSRLYAPAYYEDADLCFGLRSMGYRVVYDPHSEVVHFEGVTSGTSLTSGTKRFQEINRPKFLQKWKTELGAHYENDPQAVPRAARRLHSSTGKTILVIDTHVPMHDRDAGSSRLRRILEIFRAAGHHVKFLPDNYAPLQPYTHELQNLGIEVIHHTDAGMARDEALREALSDVDLAWICRPDLFTKYAPIIRKHRAVKLVYDTIDLHFVRAQRENAVLGKLDDDWKSVERQELAAAAAADATVVVSNEERATLQARGINPIYVVPTIHEIEIEHARRFEESEGVLFIGGYNHPPNVDAAVWLINEIMPLVWNAHPDVPVTLLGSNPPAAVTGLESPRVKVPGYVQDVAPFFLSHRVFAASMRFGAGMKGKVGHALSYGLPVVSTAVGAEGFAITDQESCLIANDAPAFAQAICRFYDDRLLWERTSRAAIEALLPLGAKAVSATLAQLVRSLTGSVYTAEEASLVADKASMASK